MVFVGGKQYWVLTADEQLPEWPERTVKTTRVVENIFDDQGEALEATLNCGHMLYLSGRDRALATIRCRHCFHEQVGWRWREDLQ